MATIPEYGFGRPNNPDLDNLVLSDYNFGFRILFCIVLQRILLMPAVQLKNWQYH
jgi:hypothetical protein